MSTIEKASQIVLSDAIRHMLDMLSPDETLDYIAHLVDERSKSGPNPDHVLFVQALRPIVTYQPSAIAIDSVQALKDQYNVNRIFWITYKFEDCVETYPTFYTGFGTFHEVIEGAKETIEFIDGFDFADGIGIDYVLWTHRPTEQQIKEYVWKENS